MSNVETAKVGLEQAGEGLWSFLTSVPGAAVEMGQDAVEGAGKALATGAEQLGEAVSHAPEAVGEFAIGGVRAAAQGKALFDATCENIHDGIVDTTVGVAAEVDKAVRSVSDGIADMGHTFSEAYDEAYDGHRQPSKVLEATQARSADVYDFDAAGVPFGRTDAERRLYEMAEAVEARAAQAEAEGMER